jgi:membrane fusion protein (multidrug efflux system)
VRLAQQQVERTRALFTSRAISQAQLDSDESVLQGATADARGLEAQIARKIVRAPFAGRLGIRNINLGQYLSPGTTLTTLESVDSVYVDFTLPQQQLQTIKTGMPIRLALESSDAGAFDGTITAVDPTVDATTRSMKVRAALAGKDDRLQPGMFVKVTVVLPPMPSQLAVPVTALVRATYGDSVFVVEDKKDEHGAVAAGADGKPVRVARQQFVKTGQSRGDYVILLDGVKVGEEIVVAGAFKLRNGSRVTVNNEPKLNPSTAPQLENR